MNLKVLISASALSAAAITSFSAGATYAETIRLALILPAEVNDMSWAQMAYMAGKELEESGRVDFAYTESIKPDAATLDPIIAGYAQEGYDLVIAHSFTYGKSTARLAGQFAETNFAWSGGVNGTGENLADYDQPLYQGYYLAGIVAAGLSETGTLASLTGFDIPVCHAAMAAFGEGARSVNPDIKVLSNVTGSFTDVAKAKQAALGLADQGADHFMSCGQGVTLGTIQAAKERKLGAAGYIGDMSSLAPEAVYASVIWNLDVLFTTIVDDVEAGNFRPGKAYSLGVREGGISLAINDSYGKEIPDALRAKVDDAVASIKAGTLEVPFVPN